MDVRFSNVIESTRQYFQGVPVGPPPGQAPAQRPSHYWTSSHYPPVSSAPSPLPYPHTSTHSSHHRLPSIGTFSNGQQRSLPSVSQIKQGLGLQDYPGGYPGRAYKYPEQQAGAALYNSSVSPSSLLRESPRSALLPGQHHQGSHLVPGSQHQASHVSLPQQQHQGAASQHQAAASQHQAAASQHQAAASQHQAAVSHHQAAASHHQAAPASQHQASPASKHIVSPHVSQQSSSQQSLHLGLPQHVPTTQSSLLHSSQLGLSHIPSQLQALQHHPSQLQTGHVPSQHQGSHAPSVHQSPLPAGQHQPSHNPPQHQSHSSGTQHPAQNVSLQQPSHSQHQTHAQHQSQTHAQHQSSPLVPQHHPPSQHASGAFPVSHHLNSSQHLSHLQAQHLSRTPSQLQASPQPAPHHSSHQSSSQHQAGLHQSSQLALQQQAFHHQSPGQQQTYLQQLRAQQTSQQSYHQALQHHQQSSSSSHIQIPPLHQSLSRSLHHQQASYHSSPAPSQQLTNYHTSTSLQNQAFGVTAKSSRLLNQGNVINHAGALGNLAAAVSHTPETHSSANSASHLANVNHSSALSHSSSANLNSNANVSGHHSSLVNLSNNIGASAINLSNNVQANPAPPPSAAAAPTHRSILSSAVKRESPLDLSVKTIRQSADSTALDDQEYLNHLNYEYIQQRTTPKASVSSYDRSSQAPVTAPKSDFTPNFSALAKKRKPEETSQTYYNTLPSIGSFSKCKTEPFSYYHRPSTSSYNPVYPQASLPVKQQTPQFKEEPPSKLPRLDSWRQTIDQQIENKLNSYLSAKNGERIYESPQGGFRYPYGAQYLQKNDNKPVVNGQADKRVLNILRNSLETKSEARNHAKTPDRQPKGHPAYRHKLPPFGVIGTVPKELVKPVEIVDITDDTEETEPKKGLTNGGSSSNGELDGLAAFLAARIRTKAELKQVDPERLSLPPPQSLLQPAYLAHTTPKGNQSPAPGRRPTSDYIELVTVKLEADPAAKLTISPPKLTKEHGPPSTAPRRRMFSKGESGVGEVVCRGGVRVDSGSPLGAPLVTSSSQATSVFDFRGSESESEMPVLERQQRKNQLQPPKPIESPRPLPPNQEELTEEEREWFRVCDELLEELKHCPVTVTRKKVKRKRRMKREKQVKEEKGEEGAKERAKSEGSDSEEDEVAWRRRGGLFKKKRVFGDGSAFSPGWQEELYRFKQSLRMPDSLISVARPTSSLPDLQTCYMDSPGAADSDTSPVKPKTAQESIARTLNREKCLLDSLMDKFNKLTPQAKEVPKDPDKDPSATNPFLEYLKKERSRGRSESRRLVRKKASPREALGEERPASAPPAGVRDGGKKPSPRTKLMLRSMLTLRSQHGMRGKLLGKEKQKKRRRGTVKLKADSQEKRLKPGRRKQLKSSGFDYLKKKKKQNKDPNEEKKIKKKKSVPLTEPEIQAEIKSWVLNKGAGETLLHRAARLGYVEVMQYCLDVLQLKPSVRDNAGYTALHEASSRGHIDVAKLLLAGGADVNDSAQGGIRPLHEAAENGFIDVIEVLLAYGADPELATYSGHTALSLAADEDTRQLMKNYKQSLLPSTPPQPIIETEGGEMGVKSDGIEGFEIEESDILLPSLYKLQGEPRGASWVLLHELAPLVKAKTKESLIRMLGAGVGQDTRDLKPTEFYNKARTRTLVMGDTERRPPKLATKMLRVTLVRYTEAVRSLLGIETTVIPR